MNPKISIIIPCKNIDAYTLDCIDRCKALDYENFEIITLPDYNPNLMIDVKMIPTGEVSPGKKRNIGIANSDGELLAFIDSDAYPQKDWLKNAFRYFNDSNVGAIGGPGITPKDDSLLQKAGGHVLSSFMMGGVANRYRIGKSAIVSDDIHSCNLIVRRAIIEKISGWDEKYWPGEDTLICLEIKKLGKKMIRLPDVIIYHHRKPLFIEHLRQISRYGLHRGFFAKRFPETSLRLNYFLPSTLVLFMTAGFILSIINSPISYLYISILSIYLFGVFVASIMTVVSGKDLRFFLLVFTGTITTHIVYGINFIWGLLIRELKR